MSEEATILNEGYLPDVDATQAVDSKLNGNEIKAAELAEHETEASQVVDYLRDTLVSYYMWVSRRYRYYAMLNTLLIVLTLLASGLVVPSAAYYGWNQIAFFPALQ
ncbi:MAG: hypothetical protein JOZ19_09725 [Rubrobacter sp.]|nr:hypothetical protein [Rubrobacter sp.]